MFMTVIIYFIRNETEGDNKFIKITKADFYRSPRLGSNYQKNIYYIKKYIIHREIKLVCFGICINFYFYFDLVFSIKHKNKTDENKIRV